ncbi:MAG: HEPN domain-containing protein, partial [Bacillota bacterium]
MSEQQEKRVLIDYRLARADEALKEAVLLFDAGHYNTTVNRLYYACFYAVNALLLTRGMSSAKHSGVRSLFNQHWVKKNIVPKHLGKFYMEIYEYRQKSDYTD